MKPHQADLSGSFWKLDIMHTIFVLLLVTGGMCQVTVSPTLGEDLDEEMKTMKTAVTTMARQVMMQQLAIEERVRSLGDSGVKQLRLSKFATNPYMTETHTERSNCAMHDHSNNIRTVGMGEVIAVLNGVDFRTRHNDYKLVMPSVSKTDYHTYDDIPFPDVPPEVTAAGDVLAQTEEMRLWFKAFKEQNHTERDYRKYFKPVLCYLEGAWSFSDAQIDEPFNSDRHHIDATTWFDLQDKIRYTADTGSKNHLENLAFLPTTISSVEEGELPKFAQWNYRIMCHPLSRDIPTNRFRLVEDFAARLRKQSSPIQYEKTRSARFTLNPSDTDEWAEFEESYQNGLLDELMYEIPGKDNYPSEMVDSPFGIKTSRPDDSPLNAGYYHRVYKADKKDAMGLKFVVRGYNDQNGFVAFNNQSKVMPVSYKVCSKSVCTTHESRVSHAIPLEIIYMTPLFKWNPHNIIYHGDKNDPGVNDKVTAKWTRNGALDPNKAFDGVHSRLFYRTPVELFGSGEVNKDAADTVASKVGVLDANGDMQVVAASGTRIFLPQIGDIGTTRLRYPINPVYDEGSATRKELEAIKKVFIELEDYIHMIKKPLHSSSGASSNKIFIQVDESQHNDFPAHTHTIELNLDDMEMLMLGQKLTKLTSVEEEHSHSITLGWRDWAKAFYTYGCDGSGECWDKHPRNLYIIGQVRKEI